MSTLAGLHYKILLRSYSRGTFFFPDLENRLGGGALRSAGAAGANEEPAFGGRRQMEGENAATACRQPGRST